MAKMPPRRVCVPMTMSRSSIFSAAHRNWNGNVSSESNISDAVTMTTEESDEFYAKYTDIGTYAQTELLRFVVGDNSMDQWDTFVDTCKSMGIDDCVEIYQTAYDRYEAR